MGLPDSLQSASFCALVTCHNHQPLLRLLHLHILILRVCFQWQELPGPSSSPVTLPERQATQDTGCPPVTIVFCTRQLFLQAFLALKMATKTQTPCSKHSCSGCALSVLFFHPLISSCLTSLTPTLEVSPCVDNVRPTSLHIHFSYEKHLNRKCWTLASFILFLLGILYLQTLKFNFFSLLIQAENLGPRILLFEGNSQ